MQKWHVHCGLGRSRSNGYFLPTKYPRQFSISTFQSQESDHGNPPTGQDRERDITPRVNRHFQRLDTRSPRPSFRSINLNAIDARDLAAVPNPSPPPPGRSIGQGTGARRAPLDARNLGAQRPNNPPRPFRTSNPDSQPREDQGLRISYRRDASVSTVRGGTTNAAHNRNRGGPNRPGRGGFGGGRSGAGNSRRRDGESRPRESGGGGNNRGKNRETRENPTPEEIAYLNTRETTSLFGDSIFEGGTAQYIRPRKSTSYTPATPSLDILEGRGPAIACGEWGMSETVIDTLKQVNLHQDAYDERISQLAKTWEAGNFCQFRNAQEKEDMLKTVERNVAGQDGNARLDETKEKEIMELVDTRMKEERAKLATRLLKGDYYIGPLGKGPTAELLERYTRKNETYLPKDCQALAGKVGTLLPLDQPSPSAKAATA